MIRWAGACGLAAVAVLVLAVVVHRSARAASGTPEEGAASARPAPPEPPCPNGARVLEAPAPETGAVGAGTGTLRVAGAARATCVRLGAAPARTVTVVAADGTATFRVSAHPRRLLRLRVDGARVLVRLRPGETLTLRDAAETGAGFRLDGPRLDPAAAVAPDAYCGRTARHQLLACRDGFEARSGPEPDPLCPAGNGSAEDRSRCVRAARVRLVRVGAGTPPADRALAPCRMRPRGEAFPLQNVRRWCEFAATPGHCGEAYADDCHYPALDTGSGRALLAVGVGERWSLAFDATGALDGEAE